MDTYGQVILSPSYTGTCRMIHPSIVQTTNRTYSRYRFLCLCCCAKISPVKVNILFVSWAPISEGMFTLSLTFRRSTQAYSCNMYIWITTCAAADTTFFILDLIEKRERNFSCSIWGQKSPFFQPQAISTATNLILPHLCSTRRISCPNEPSPVSMQLWRTGNPTEMKWTAGNNNTC